MPVPPNLNPPQPIKLFISYAREDEGLRNALAKQLRILQREGTITDWCEQNIAAGQDRQAESIHQLRTANIILLLISPDFIASDHCWAIMEEAICRHDDGSAIAVPVILRPCLWQKLPCSNLQCWPEGGKPIVEWPSLDHGLLDITEKLAKAVHTSPPPPHTSSTSSNQLFHVPHRRKLIFTGRDAFLKELHERLTSDSPQMRIQAITGMGGIGKTQLAVQFANQFRSNYDLVWWINAEDPSILRHEYSALSVQLRLAPPNSSLEHREITTRAWLESHDRWLLIFDNAPGPDEVNALLPSIPQGHILITSRERAWRKLAHPYPLEALERKASIDFLLATTGQTDRSGADLVANTLGDLPLALVQASAYMDAEGIPLASYASLFETRHKELWAREENHAPYDHYDTVLTTLTICIDRARKRAPQAQALLNLFAFLSPSGIPKTLLSSNTLASLNQKTLPPPLRKIVRDPIAFGASYATLGRYGLLETDQHSFVHRLTQTVARDRLGKREVNLWLQSAIDILHLALPEEQADPNNWPAYYLLAPHCYTVAQHAQKIPLVHPRLIAILNWTGIFWKSIGALPLAEACFRHSCSFLDSDHSALEPIDISSTLGNMCGVLIDMERTTEALPYVEKAIRNASSFRNETDPNLGTHLTNHAVILSAQGEHARANDLIQRATRILIKDFGPQDPSLTHHLNSFANICSRHGHIQDAERYYKMAAELQLSTYGESRPMAALPLMNLARLLLESNQLAESEKIAHQARRIVLRFFPEEHPWATHCNMTLKMIRDQEFKTDIINRPP